MDKMQAWIDENVPTKDILQTIFARIKSGKVYSARVEFPKGKVKVDGFKRFCKKEGIEVTN